MQEARLLLVESLRNQQTPYRVFIPGLTGGGRLITAIRDSLHTMYGEDVYVPSSILSREGHRRGEGLRGRYQRLAGEIAGRAQGRDIDFTVHSSGGHEAIDLLTTMLDQQDTSQFGKHIRINFLSTPGFMRRGIGNAFGTLQNLEEMGHQVALLEQHMTYPLPEAYYMAHPQQNPQLPQLKTVFTDSEQLRSERRERFRERWLPRLMEDNRGRKRTEELLDAVDSQIARNLAGGLAVDTLLARRASILAPLIQNLFHGKHIDESTHDHYLREYQETVDALAPVSHVYVNALLYTARMGKRIIARGMDKAVADVVEKAQAKGVDVSIEFSFLERDSIVPFEKINAFMDGVSASAIGDAVDGWHFVQQYAHSTVGYDPDLLEKF